MRCQASILITILCFTLGCANSKNDEIANQLQPGQENYTLLATAVEPHAENIELVRQKNVTEIKLEISDDLQKTLDIFYSIYPNDSNKRSYLGFNNYLNAYNKWIEAKITVRDQTYRVKIKLHGKSPVGHVEGDHYSLG